MRTFQKRFLSLALVGSAITAFATTPLLGQDITTGLVGHWTFDDETLDESSGFQPDGVHDGIAVGTIAYTDDTPAGGFALDMTADGDSLVQVLNSNAIVGGAFMNTGVENETYQSTFDPPVLGEGFSIAFWGRGTPGRWAPFVSKNGEGRFGGNGYQVRRRNLELRTTFTLRRTDGDDDPVFENIFDTFDADETVDPEWHHYTATWTAGESGGRSFYIDGQLVGFEDDFNENPGVDALGEPILPDNSWANSSNEFLVFGGRDFNLFVDGENVGTLLDSGALCMDDIRIYNRPLDAQAAAILATPFDETAVLLGDVNLDEFVNFLDIAPFILVLSTPGADQAEADTNEDGEVTFLDIAPFINILANQ